MKIRGIDLRDGDTDLSEEQKKDKR